MMFVRFRDPEKPETMNPTTPSSPAQDRRPSWFARTPDFELDCRAEGAGAPGLKAIIAEADRVSRGQMLAVRLGFEPALLCRMLGNRGFNHWAEPEGNGDWKIYFLRKA